MSSIAQYIRLLSCTFVSEISIPNEYLYIYDIILVLQTYRWTVLPSHIAGLSTLTRNIVYNN